MITGTDPEILSRLEDVRTTSTGWQARCPGHADTNASLSIDPGDDGRLLLYCHAGCPTAEILQAIGMKLADLMPKQNGGVDNQPHHTNGSARASSKTLGRIVAAYDYRDESGALLYQVVRLEPKDFRQRRPQDGGGWAWKMDGVRRVLYRLPELLAADAAATVFACEGERDCERLTSFGLVATTNVGGAKKWKPEYNEALRGRRVAVLADNDDAGRQHGIMVANSLIGLTASVKVIELPGLAEHGDVSDWLDAGGTPEALEALVAAAAEAVKVNAPQRSKVPTVVVSAEATGPRSAADTQGVNGDGSGILPIERPLVCNAERVGSGEDAEMNVRSMADIIDQLLTAAKGWPRRVDDSLFIDDHRHGLKHLEKCAELFGWIHSLAGVRWYQSTGCVSREELFSEVKRTVQAYRAIEAYPHFPALTGHYYSHPLVEPGDGSTLRALLDRFCPATPIDLDLILALFATGTWGGAGGTRPVFVIASDAGRGTGKTKLLELLGILLGGVFSISQTDRIADIVKRLLTPAAATKRITAADNVKTNKFSWAEYESLVTARDISGHRLYSGERTRPNTLTHTLTLNGPSLSRDMAQRSIVIKLSRPVHSGNWEDDAKAFVESNRWRIIADLAAFFLRPAPPLDHHTRWGTWEREVLARLPEPAEAQKVIAERQTAVNADDEEAADVADHFRQELERLGYDAETDNVHIPNELARGWFCRAIGDKVSATAVTRAIHQCHDEGTLPRLKVNPCRTNGRGFLWLGDGSAAVLYDIADRQQTNGWQENRHWDR